MRRVVLDTNILVSVLWSDNGNPYSIVELFFRHKIEVLYNAEIMEEYADVLGRTKLGFSNQRVLLLLQEIEKHGVPAIADQSEAPFTDEDDKVFYDVAKAYGAVLITGNKRHFPDEPFIMTPAEFLADQRD